MRSGEWGDSRWDQCPYKERCQRTHPLTHSVCTEKRSHEDRVRRRRLRARKRAFTRTRPCRHSDLRLPASRTVSKHISVHPPKPWYFIMVACTETHRCCCAPILETRNLKLRATLRFPKCRAVSLIQTLLWLQSPHPPSPHQCTAN